MKESRPSINYSANLKCITLLLLLCGGACAQDLVLKPLGASNFRFKDISGHHYSDTFTKTYDYANSNVKISIDSSDKAYLSGLVQATGLKPNFAYQIKLSGRNSKLTTESPDDATNERLGLIGRWWRAYPNPANSNDADYNANKDNPTYAYTGYLIIAFFMTDASGAANVRFEGNNSFHVLWRTDQRQTSSNDGPPQTVVLPTSAGNPAYDPATPSPAATLGLYGEWEPTRALPGTLIMPAAHYSCAFILTEESFHDSGTDAGNWTAVLGAPIDFEFASGFRQSWPAPAGIVYPAALTTDQLNATANVSGTFMYSPPLGTVLKAGTQKLSAQFKPTDPTIETPLPLTVSINVAKGTPQVSWNPERVVRANAPLGALVYNASADVFGTVEYDVPASGMLSPGKHEVTLTFRPNDSANYNVPAPITIEIEAITGLLISSGPDAFPNPAYAGWSVSFVTASIARAAAWSWDFGDGSPVVEGGVVDHVYATPGEYTATVTIKISGGRTESATTRVTVLAAAAKLNPSADDDGDGYSNALELVLGSDWLSAKSTPMNARAAPSKTLNISRCLVEVPDIQTFAPGGIRATRVTCSAQLQMPAAFDLAGKILALDLGGNVLRFQLDSAGRARSNGRKAHVRVTRFGLARIEISADGFTAPSDVSGVLQSPVSGGSANASAVVVLGDQSGAGTVQFSVTKKKGAFVFSFR